LINRGRSPLDAAPDHASSSPDEIGTVRVRLTALISAAAVAASSEYGPVTGWPISNSSWSFARSFICFVLYKLSNELPLPLNHNLVSTQLTAQRPARNPAVVVVPFKGGVHLTLTKSAPIQRLRCLVKLLQCLVYCCRCLVQFVDLPRAPKRRPIALRRSWF
jgi:hypothetical protein